MFKNIQLKATQFLFVLQFAFAPFAFADDTLTGIYTGSMHLVDGVERDIPLAMSLLITDEAVSTPNGLEYIIDGAFVVDDEGGPYSFTRITYDIEANRVDMKYSRPRSDPTTVSPASLRFVGNLDASGNISGKVNSGLFGMIGTFKVIKNAALTTLPIRHKYIGTWKGSGNNIPYAEKHAIEISLRPSAMASTNPSNFELEYTPGKLGGYSANDAWISTFNHVAIDYLRRKLVMSSQTGYTSIDFEFSPDSTTISGAQSSAAFGLTVVFEKLFKIP